MTENNNKKIRKQQLYEIWKIKPEVYYAIIDVTTQINTIRFLLDKGMAIITDH